MSLPVPTLEVRSLSKTYPNSVTALEPTSLTVQEGEWLVLMGPSGAGKSTLLRLVAGLETPSSGEILLRNREIQHLEPYLRKVAWLSQKPALFPHLDVRENLAIGLRLQQKHLPKRERIPEGDIRRKVSDASELLRIESLLDRPVHHLSGGEQQRVALGRAIVKGASLWLLDEPFSQLDSHLRQEIRAEFLLLRRRFRATIILITHDRTEALALADRIGVLGRGRLLQVDSPAEIVTKPRHRVVATCLGWPAMNFAEGGPELLEGSVFRFWGNAIPPGCTLGIHPRDVRLVETRGDDPDWVPFGTWRVERELPGSEPWLLVSNGTYFWHAPEPGDGTWEVGREREMLLRRDRIVWFSRDGSRVERFPTS